MKHISLDSRRSSTEPKVTKKKEKTIHPCSRKALLLSRREHHNIRVERRKEELGLKQRLLYEKLKWFKANLDKNWSSVSAKNVMDLIDRYFHRFDDELEQINIVNGIKGRTGNQHVSRENSIQFTVKQENNDYTTCGLEIPDLLNKESYEYFKLWNGDSRYLPAIKVKKYTLQKLQELYNSEQKELNSCHNNEENITDRGG